MRIQNTCYNNSFQANINSPRLRFKQADFLSKSAVTELIQGGQRKQKKLLIQQLIWLEKIHPLKIF